MGVIADWLFALFVAACHPLSILPFDSKSSPLALAGHQSSQAPVLNSAGGRISPGTKVHPESRVIYFLQIKRFPPKTNTNRIFFESL